VGTKAPSVSIFGLGYVGSVTAACLAHRGHRVMGVDVNPSKVQMLEEGRSPVVEAQLDQLVADSRSACRLHATTDAVAAVLESDISFACVGTPGHRSGKIDLAQIEHACQEIGRGLASKNSFHTVVLRSTVLPGTTETVAIPALERASGKQAGRDFAVCYNPEFIREGTAVADFFEPPYTILGCQTPEHLALLREVYNWVESPVFETTLSAAEMAKYLSNAFHALKVGFANEVGTLAKHFGVDTAEVMRIFMSDKRLNISPAYLAPGFAFGGSCLPKDLSALLHRARELDLRMPLLDAILASNTEHLERAVEVILRTHKKKMALLGLSFKAGTDDLRESPQVRLSKRLIGEGCQVRIWDPYVSLGHLVGSNRQFIDQVIPHIGSLLSQSLEEVVASAEVVIIGTKAVERSKLLPLLRDDQMVIDLVNFDKSSRPDANPSYQGLCW
jgi:GDP-mannose 6-dehydrogenase